MPPKYNRRMQKRLSKRYPVHFGPDEPINLGFSKNISLGGMELASITVFPSGTHLKMVVEADGNSIEVKGLVSRIYEADRMEKMSGMKSTMGIKLIERSDQYADVILKAFDSWFEKRRDQRFGKVLKVIFENPKELLERYTQDISRGGIFIVSDQAPALNSLVEVQIIIAGTMQVVRAEGIVVHAISREMVEKYGLNPGFGVQFTEFHDNGLRILDAYIKELEDFIEA